MLQIMCDFSRVCKRLAFLVATDGSYLAANLPRHGVRLRWDALPLAETDSVGCLRHRGHHQEIPEGDVDQFPLTLHERAERHAEEGLANTMAFYNSLYGSSWQRMFQVRPRIRFNGCYISTVNYIRAGQASFQIRWDNPIHIVTYYRYLRFFRDGTLLSLTTTAEPADVVHHMTREALGLHKDGAMSHLPGVVMQSALRGRWRLAGALDHPDASISEVEGDVLVETEGVGKYTYRMDLSLRTAGKGTRNNKMIWRGFYSYDRLTDDWAEFTQKNDKPYFFSRVKSYGVGE